ncbi:TonB-dependent receptor [Kaistella daneshvariae]|uniref:TonB-dependent receptor n=1 Tax=Kaistella daneshvariae TaxID=2487074 RepID=A0ABM7C957_9FLAO|nr:TonB-dependent receptor plug domain-containing protein [Kaistella daneshvariae]AZI67522.1 TonB-dependent receptor [Kaistella daneshvariae]
MKIRKLGLAFIMLNISATYFYAQDTINKEKKIDEVVITSSANKKTESALLVDQKKSIIQKQSMGSEEISRKGLSNVEQALVKVTGITNVEGRGLFVRGLEDRYNTLLINGLGSPSNNPFQKIIALKQFPTDVVGKLNIYKTFNSNLYADFAGATFDIETLTYEKPFSKVEFGIGINTLSTFRNDFKINPNANTIDGFIGLNSKKRQLPQQINGYRPSSYNFNAEESRNSFGEGWNVDNIKSLPNTSLGFTTAQKFKIGETSNLGFLFSLNQGNNFQYKEGEKNQFRLNGNSIDYNNLLNRKEYIYETESSVLLGLGFKNKGTAVNLNGFFLQNSENLIQDYQGYRNGETNNQQFIRVNQQDISRFTDLQLTASQKISDRHSVKAGASWVNNFYQQPDRKIMYGRPVDNNEINLSFGGNNLLRQYLDVNGKNYFSAFAEYAVNLGEKGDKKDFPLQIAFGYNGFADVRNTSYRFIYSVLDNPANSQITVDRDAPQALFDQALSEGTYHYREGSTSEYKNNLYQFVNAGYLNLNYKPSELWDILVGGRIENNVNITRYKPISVGINDDFVTLSKNQYYILPSLSVKRSLNPKSNIRFAASKTITRPILIEYMPITYINPDNENIFGNKNLTNSENYNFDLKYEIFPSNKEMFAVNLFAKKIDKAIERSYIASGNSNGQTITFFNSKTANLAGVELEGIFSLNRFSEALSRWTFGANTTLMYSDVQRSTDQSQETDVEANRKRALQGAAPWTVNADLKYEYKNAQNFTKTYSLVYNVSGKKIYGVGFSKLDNIYEMPFHQLDFVYNNQISKNWNVKFAIQNLLNSQYNLKLGDNSLVQVQESSLLMENYKKGTSFNMTIGYTF